jgi:hypothetical protein
MNINELKEILSGGGFNSLIGKIENHWFECKKAPYFLENAKHKQELAKDIAGMANADGGIILIGVKTEKNEIHFGDEVVKINPFAQNLVNHQDYINIVNSRTYPNIINIKIEWFKSASDNNLGIVAIEIPPQPISVKPFLLTRTYDENEKLTEISFGYCERKRDNIESLNIERLHSIIKDGLRFDEINQRIDSIELILHKLVDNSQNINFASVEAKYEKMKESVASLIPLIDLRGTPYFTLAICPDTQSEIKGIFEGRNGEVVKLIDNPPELRYSGFNLDTEQSSKIIEGKKRRSIEKGSKALELWKDGTLIFAANAGPDFLSWGNYDKQNMLRINDYALIEVCYLFCLLVKELVLFYAPLPEYFLVNIQLKNLPSQNCFILGTQGFSMHNPKVAPGQENDFYLKLCSKNFSPEIASFQLASSVYEWFGVEHSSIPLSIKKDDIYQIDPDAIRNLR